MKREQKMNMKNLMVFCTFALALFLIGSVAAADTYDISDVTVNGYSVFGLTPADVSVVAGEDFDVKVYFNPSADDTDTIVTVEVEGEKVEFDASTSVFDVISGKAYKKVLSLYFDCSKTFIQCCC
jgi:hypothetical protein